jgi:hypothetical protein
MDRSAPGGLALMGWFNSSRQMIRLGRPQGLLPFQRGPDKVATVVWRNEQVVCGPANHAYP